MDNILKCAFPFFFMNIFKNVFNFGRKKTILENLDSYLAKPTIDLLQATKISDILIDFYKVC